MKKIFSILKQEIFFIPLMLIFLEGCRAAIHAIWPETAFFDRGSELETYLSAILKVVLGTTSVWIILRVVFPDAYKALQDFYHKFSELSDSTRRYYSIRIFLCFFLSMVYLMKANTPEGNIRIKLVDTLHAQMYVREATGNNDGKEVESYLSFVHAKKGNAWCAAFCCTNLNAVGVTPPINPLTAWAPSFANERYIVWSPGLEKQHKVKMQPAPGDCFTIAYSGTNSVEHVGFIIGQTDGYFITTEGNTGRGLDQGVHSYKRDKHKIFAITNYITPYLKSHEKTNSTFYFNKPLHSLQSQNVSIGRKNNYNEGLNYRGTRYVDFTRHNICFQRGQLADTGSGNSRQERQSRVATNDNRNTPLKKYSFYYEWRDESRLYMQRIRANRTTTRTAYYRAYEDKRKTKNRYTNNQNGRGKIYPKVC
jgi:hypothetical protein